MKKIILASASPRRRELLEMIGLPHEVRISQAAEEFSDGLKPHEVAMELAFKKAEAVAADINDGIVIGADTIVVLDNKVLGKPRNKEHAVEILQNLQGRSHYVITGLTVIDTETGNVTKTFARTHVVFKKLEKDEIEAYVNLSNPIDKAGAYGIQERGSLLVQEIKGCYFNVVGMPLPLLADVLKKYDINILVQK